MANPASIFRLPEEPPLSGELGDLEEDGAQFLEIRTENGAIYLRPSRWQRLRLQWTFRHFRVLSPEVLSPADKRLIETLTESAAFRPARPLPAEAVFGVVEKPRPKPPASANRVLTMKPAPVQVPLAKPVVRDVPSPDVSAVLKPKAPIATKSTETRDIPFSQWGDVGALAAVGLVVILATVYRAPLFSSAARLLNRPTSTPIEHAASHIKPNPHSPAISPVLVSPANAWVSYVRPHSWVAPTPSEPALATKAPAPLAPTSAAPAPASSSTASARPFVAELPHGYFAHPVVSDSNSVGELQLKALIGADGSVKDVTVLSGKPELAKAGMRAVRQWHYSPYQVEGAPVEVETQIKMSFFGPDAVSIASVANASPAQSK